MKNISFRIGLALLALVFSVSNAEARYSGIARTQPIDMVVIHSTGGPFCDKETGKPIWVGGGTLDANLKLIEAHPKLGIHYMIDRDGTLRASVPEGQMTHHIMHYSVRSIAVELINNGDGRDPFPEAQMTALVNLLRDIRQRHSIRRDGIKRHSDLDHSRLACDKNQRRKVDPGDAFPYQAVLDRVFQPQ
jgi:hypothetical protein